MLRGPMANAPSWWQKGRVPHRDAVVLCVVSSAFLFAGEFSAPLLREIYGRYLEPVQGNLMLFVARAFLALFAFTTAFGAFLVLLSGWYFLRDHTGAGRFLLGFGIGLTSLTLASRLAYASLVYGTPLAFLVPLATSLTGVGILFGLAAHVFMGRHVMGLKKAWRRWRQRQDA